MYQSTRNNFLEYLFLKMVRATFVDIVYTQILQTVAGHVFFFWFYTCMFLLLKKKKRSKVTYVQRILTASVHAFVHGSELKNSEYLEMR